MRKQRKTRFFETPPIAKFCVYCKGGDGSAKEIYASKEEALRRAEYIREERGTALKAYPCPKSSGWHLTKDSTDADEDDYTAGASVYTGKISWEYTWDGAEKSVSQRGSTGGAVTAARKPAYKKPIVKIESKAGKSVTLSGKISELIKGVNIEKIEKLFNIKLDNPFSAHIAKDFIDGEYYQITVFTEDSGTDKIKSWTALLKKPEIKITKDDNVKITLIGKTINRKNIWHCVNITKDPPA
ncbi:MAG: hypothetical protein LBK66_11285, partial [Spirochaetaceae bacterium]|nr:hypothetical protein [Spirochaetaceae bacterium]